jgi:hypothetical protein
MSRQPPKEGNDDEPLVSIGSFSTFNAAQEKARDIAASHSTAISIVRTPGGWDVLAPSWIKQYLDGEANDKKWRESSESSFVDPDDEKSELINELYEDAENWSSSKEDGWFYPDADDE